MAKEVLIRSTGFASRCCRRFKKIIFPGLESVIIERQRCLRGPVAEIRDQVIKIIQKMPKNTSVEDIMEELYFKMRVDKAIGQLDRGEHVSQEDVKKRVSKWIK